MAIFQTYHQIDLQQEAPTLGEFLRSAQKMRLSETVDWDSDNDSDRDVVLFWAHRDEAGRYYGVMTYDLEETFDIDAAYLTIIGNQEFLHDSLEAAARVCYWQFFATEWSNAAAIPANQDSEPEWFDGLRRKELSRHTPNLNP